MIWVRIVAVLLLSGAPGAAAPPAAGADALRADVQAFVKAYVDAQNKVDASAVMEMTSKRAGVASISMGDITRGWEAIRTDMDSMVGAEGQITMALGTIDVSPLGTGFALAFAPCTITMVSVHGRIQMHGAFTVVLEKAAGKWKVFHEHSSIQLPSEDAQ
jgi:ketosteroid isomerase-like protein